MKVLKHIFKQPFVAATGAAALLHSTWSLGTLFAGKQPEGWQVVGWLAPALLIAFALDVGQIVTSAEIRTEGLTWTRGVTFVVFAGATYYLQWLYIAHHMPALELAPGVRETWARFATVMRDSAVWIIPALLPLSTLLYTFSGGKTQDEHQDDKSGQVAAPSELLFTQQSTSRPALPNATKNNGENPLVDEEGVIEQGGQFIARYGAWEKGYPTLASAQRGLAGYKGQSKKQLLSANGHSAAAVADEQS